MYNDSAMPDEVNKIQQNGPHYDNYLKLIGGVFPNEALSQRQKLRQLFLYTGGLTAVCLFFWTLWTCVRHYYAGKAGQCSVFDFFHNARQLLSSAGRSVYLQSTNVAITGILTQLALLIVILYGGYVMIAGGLMIGELIAVTMYLGPFYLPLQRFSELNVVFANSTAVLERLMRGRTTFIIAHRLSPIVRADKILVLREGCAVESGTHAQLMARGGVYQSFYQQVLV